LGEDGRRDVAERHVGAFGFPAPYGHEPLESASISFNMDIVGGAVGSLCQAYREVARFGSAGHRVNLLFDRETAQIEVQSPYTHPKLGIRVKRPGPLFVRMPEWVDTHDLLVCGTEETPRYTNGYLFLAQPPVNRWVTMDLRLPVHEISLAHRTREIRVRLQGDAVIEMDSFGADLTFFEGE
jgi:hypothetical protein